MAGFADFGQDIPNPRGVIRRGISNDQSTAITDGLAEGDQVVIPTTQTRAPTVGGPGGGFGGGLPIR